MTSSCSDAFTQQLKTAYKEIAERAALATPQWPDSTRFIQMLDFHPNPREDHQDGVYTHHYRAPTFPNDEGPLGLIALILNGAKDGTDMYNPQAISIIEACQEQFNSFEHDLRHLCQDLTLHMIPTQVPHICIAIYQEHPRLLLDQAQRDSWRPTDAAAVERLVHDLNTVLHPLYRDDNIGNIQPIHLTLEALVITPDGAMIAGFVPANETTDGARYRTMKQGTSAAAQASLGRPLTSRPKNLIHVTVGRILGFGDPPPSSSMMEQAQVCQLVKRYNQQLLPTAVQSLSQRTFVLQHVSLIRNTVWFCEQNVIYKTWNLSY